ncbi:MAG: hypothetical protein AAGA77_21555 [Bacteroidota bacterium]
MNYLKFSRFLTLTTLLFLFLGSAVNAQCSYPIVSSNCVGACGSPTEINYTVSQPCIAKVRKYCVTNDASSLCPDHNAFVVVLVDGVLVASGNITAVGSSVGFKAKCGSDIKVIATTFFVGGGISCVWLGNVTYSLRQQ